MSQNPQDVTKPFTITAGTAKSGQTDVLEVGVKNDSTETFQSLILIELKLPVQMVSKAVSDAAVKARTNQKPKNMATLDGVVTAPAGWTVWAYNDPNEHIVVLRVLNTAIDINTSKPTGPLTAFAPNASFKLPIPLAAAAPTTLYTLDYGYQTAQGKKTRVDGSIDITPAGHDAWKPVVVFECDKKSTATMLDPGEKVTINWEIKDGIAATLRGPLPGGNSQLVLTRGATGPYMLELGSMSFLAVGPTTYVLDAEVKGPEGQGNVQVLRTLSFDIFSPQNYAHVSVRPDSVMPNGQVQIKWAVWGVQTASIKVGSRHSLDLELTEQNLSRYYQGTGVWRVNAAPNKATEKVRLSITTDGDESIGVSADINANKWEQIEDKPNYTGTPLAIAVTTGGHLGLLTSDGLRVADVGTTDPGAPDPDFKKLPVTAQSWHGLTTLGADFVLLRRQSENNNFVIESYDPKGTNKGSLTLPGDFQTIAGRVGATFDLVSYNGRVYVVAEASFNRRFARVAYSVVFAPDANIRPEPRLSTLNHYRLACFANALYMYNRGSGRMYRFVVATNGELGPPHRAASAVNDEGVSMIKTGTVVPIGSLLAVLDPSALPSFLSNPADPITALLNVAGFKIENLQRPLRANEIPQDIVYNPQKDTWIACGRGLKVEAGTVLGYRGGKSPRLWAAKPDGTWFKLAGANEKAFAPEFVYQYTTKPLPAALDGVREFTISNYTGIELVPLDDVCRQGALASFEAEGPAELLSPMPQSMRSYGRHPFKIAYSKSDPAPVILRLMAGGCRGPRYFLEVTLSGTDLTKITYGFKRLADDGTVAAVPNASGMTVNSRDIGVAETGTLSQFTSLYIMNQTPYNALLLDPSPGLHAVSVWDRLQINYQTPRFKIFVGGQESLGHIWVDIDFTATGGDCEVTTGSEPQRCRMRLNTAGLKKLEVLSDTVTASHARNVEYEKYDGSKFFITTSNQDVMANTCQIRLLTKTKLDGVRLGDGALSPDRKWVVLALASPENVTKARVLRFDAVSLDKIEKAYDTKGNVFSVPNAITASQQYYDAMFAEPMRYSATYDFGVAWPQHFDGYEDVLALASSHGRNVFNVVRKGSVFYLTVAYNGNNVEETRLDNISHPAFVMPLAVSPDGNTAAIADKGGVLIVDMRAAAGARKARSVRIRSATEPAHIVFSNDGRWVYCAHASPMPRENPRRLVHGGQLLVSRVNVNDAAQSSLVFPNVPDKFGLTADTRQPRPMGVTIKEQFAFSLAVSPDDRSLFASAGATIMRVKLDTFELTPWRAKVELPCRLIGVAPRSDNAWMVFALGSDYVGDGTKVDEYKTHLYHILGPKG